MSLENVRGLVLDLDGCVYVGQTPFPGAVNAVNRVKKHVRVVFMTNNSTLTRKQYADKLRKMGIETSADEIVTSGWVAARYVKKLKQDARILAVGEDGIIVEATNIGLEVVDHQEWRKADFVVVGLDRTLTYDKLAHASLAVLSGAKFVATNLDHVYPSEKGFLPGAGSIAAMISTATGVKPVAVGKPMKESSLQALELLQLPKEQVVFVGDRVDTDVEAAKIVGCRSVLVKTGAFEMFAARSREADVVLESIAALPDLLGLW
ncbi:MAG: HAD-IIA family hydrolase [Candidatus Caldarchaeum sp.]|nr:HAD-IIA family hydrolase [Candidatus Caldarchaeum sp.]